MAATSFRLSATPALVIPMPFPFQCQIRLLAPPTNHTSLALVPPTPLKKSFAVEPAPGLDQAPPELWRTIGPSPTAHRLLVDAAHTPRNRITPVGTVMALKPDPFQA